MAWFFVEGAPPRWWRQRSFLTHEQALLSQLGVNFLEDLLGQRMLLQQVAEAQQRGLVRHAFNGQIDTHKVAHCLAVIDGILQCLIGQDIPLLEEVDPQHALQANRRPTPLADRIREIGCRQCIDQSLPLHQRLHLGQEPFPASDLLLVLVLCLGERDLLHRMALSDGGRWSYPTPSGANQASAAGFVQRFLKPSDLTQVGFLIADRTAGPFCLQVACMTALQHSP